MSGPEERVRVPLDGLPAPRTPPLPHECTVAGLRVGALPPGPVELALTPERQTLNVSGVMRLDVLRVGGEDRRGEVEAGSLAWQPPGADMLLRCENPHWEPIVEVDPARLDALAHEALGARRPTEEFVFWTPDPLVAGPSSLLVEHLRAGPVDPLFVEGLAVALVARGLRVAAGPLGEVSTRGTDRRVARAIEHAEAHLDRPLGLAELADVAGMSPWHFLRCFRAATGRTPAAWVRARRVARARRLLAGPMPLAEIAFASGFASQSHMGQVFREEMGVTPGAYRAAIRG